MKRITLLIAALFFFALSVKAQYGFYLEDQIYINGTYNALVEKSDSIRQGGFSNGFNVGYIRDIPLNKRRNIGVGIGIAFSSNHFYQNVAITGLPNGSVDLRMLEDNTFIRNKFSVNYLEFPFELRYRTSTFEDDDFFRFYLGIKAGYKLRSYAKIKTEVQEVAFFNQNIFNWWRYGLTLTVGYSTWNLYMYYGLNNIFKDGLEAQPISPNNSPIPMDMNELNIGLIFYLI